MNMSLGLIELRSIAIGIKAADEMLKSADVELVLATPICPGKYVILVTGNVGSVKNAVETGIKESGIFIVDSHIINNVNEKVIPALSGTSSVDKVKSIGVIESLSALASIKAGDIAVKASNVELLEIRIARGLGGKGFVILSGELSSVNSAVKACINQLQEGGQIIGSSIIASPNKELINKLL